MDPQTTQPNPVQPQPQPAVPPQPQGVQPVPVQTQTDPSFPPQVPKNGSSNIVKVIITVLLVLALTGLLGFFSYQYFKNSEEDNTNEVNQNTTQGTTQATTNVTSIVTDNTTSIGDNSVIDPYDGWQTINIFNNTYSIKIPSNWTVTSNLVTELVPGETSAMVYFKNQDTNEELALGNYFQTGEPGSPGGCGINQGVEKELFSIDILGHNGEQVTIGECYDGETLVSRMINMSVEGIIIYDSPLAFGLTINDTTSTIEQLKEKYIDIQYALESIDVL